MERLRKGADGLVRILTIEELYLFEGAAVGFNAVEAPHVDDYWSYLLQLVNTGGILAGRLPHVSVNEREFDFTSHIVGIYVMICLEIPLNILQI
jgi:hypothetical protein